MTEPTPATIYHAGTPVAAASIVLAVPYTCRKCGAVLGQYVYAHGRVCIDQGKGVLAFARGWCFNPNCGKPYHYASRDCTLEQVVGMREGIEGGEA